MVGVLHHEEGVDLVPANLELSAMEFNLVNAMSRETALRNYLSEVKDKYDYDTGVTAEYGDKLLTISTCEYSRTNGRLVVVAKLITE